MASPLLATKEALFRTVPVAGDRQRVLSIVRSTRFFNAAEIEVAAELVEERLARGERSGYRFVFAERDGISMGYACYGPIAGTVSSFDLYWIAVHARCQGQGWGGRLIAEAERLMAQAGGHRVYVQTSSRTVYAPTRAFYERAGYRHEATLADFYAPGDDKVIFVRALPDASAYGAT